MIVSHEHGFVFMKTRRTAGMLLTASVEIARALPGRAGT